MHVLLLEFICMQVLTEARKMYQISRNWSYEQL